MIVRSCGRTVRNGFIVRANIAFCLGELDGGMVGSVLSVWRSYRRAGDHRVKENEVY